MRPIRDISEVHPDGVLYHSAFGFARVAAVGEAGVHLAWERPGENLPEVKRETKEKKGLFATILSWFHLY